MSDRPGALASRRILVVEDEYVIAMEIAAWLEDAGAEVIGPVPSVEQALGLIADGKVDAATLDVNLGEGATSYPVADRLEALGVPYLFATGDVQPPLASIYSHRPRVEKPFMRGELVATLQRLLEEEVASEP